MRHEQTIVYQRSLALMETARVVIEQLPKGFSFLADQLRRNTSSVHHNFAEGYYQDSRRQQRRFFGYAIQSAREASASFDTALAFRAAQEKTVVQGKGLALEIVRMLSKFDRPRGQQEAETVIRGPSQQDSESQDGRSQDARIKIASNDSMDSSL
jgi:four helix bundle protein